MVMLPIWLGMGCGLVSYPDEGPVGPPCDVVQGAMDSHCVGCHGAARLGDLDLRDVGALVGMPSPTVDMPLVEAGDPDRSYLVHKLYDTHASVGGTGLVMPPGGMLDAAVRDDVRAWVVAGGACDVATPEPLRPAPAGLRTLTPWQYAASLRTVLNLHDASDAPVPRVGAWATSDGAAVGTVPESVSLDYELVARNLAAWVTDPERPFDLGGGCTPTLRPDDPCVVDVLTEVGRRAYRRPLTDAELQRWVGVATTLSDFQGDPWYGLQMALSGILQSPNFLYRVELTEPDPSAPADDPGRVRYSDYELATRLSYLLFGDTPDDELLDVVAAGGLATDAGLGSQIGRMLDDPRAARGMSSFLSELLEVDLLDTLEKDDSLYPGFADTREALAHQLVDSSTDAVMAGGFPALFTTDTWYVDDVTAPLLGLDPTTRAGWVQVPDERRGVLTMPGFLAAHSYPSKTSPALRGLFVRTRLLCDYIPPPPPDVATVLPEPDTEELVTTRELVARHMEDPSCAACHAAMDPIGLALEHFDTIGVYRDQENGLPIDASGEVDGIGFTDAVSLGEALAGHPNLAACMTARLMSFANGITVDPTHPEVMPLVDPQGDPRIILGAIARSALFRNAWEDAP